MSNYTPDCWVIVIVESPKHGKVPKLMSGWYGGYGSSDEWKLNSGIAKVVEDGDRFDVHGVSGSVNSCHKRSERASSLMLSTIDSFHERLKQLDDGSSIKIISYNEYKELNKDVTCFNIEL